MPRIENIPWTKADKRPQPIDDALFAFPACIIGTLLPEERCIPEEFRHSHGPWDRLFTALWMGTPHLDRLAKILGLRKASALEQLAEAATPPPDFYLKEGVDGETAYRHLMACMRSFEPSHQHKEAGCRYLMDLWFKKVVWDGWTFTREGVSKE